LRPTTPEDPTPTLLTSCSSRFFFPATHPFFFFHCIQLLPCKGPPFFSPTVAHGLKLAPESPLPIQSFHTPGRPPESLPPAASLFPFGGTPFFSKFVYPSFRHSACTHLPLPLRSPPLEYKGFLFSPLSSGFGPTAYPTSLSLRLPPPRGTIHLSRHFFLDIGLHFPHFAVFSPFCFHHFTHYVSFFPRPYVLFLR